MGKDEYFPLFETKQAKGRLVYRVFATSIFVAICVILIYRGAYLPNKNGEGRLGWVLLFMAEIWFTFYWILSQLLRWNCIYRYSFKDRLSKRYENDLPKVDIFVCTADPLIEPPLMVINTVLSVLAYDYPPEKLSIYLSDDGGSVFTFYALFEASHFSKNWLPYCKKYKVEPRSPAAYFRSMPKPFDATHSSHLASIKKLYEEMRNRVETATNLCQIPEEVRDQHKGFSIWDDGYTSKHDHDTILKILVDGRNKEAVDVEGYRLPTLVYLAREKRPQYLHNFKAGAMNSLLRVSSEISNGAVILNVDCDMYSNNSQSIRDALCFFMDEKKSQDIGFVQFPQNFENTTKNDIYGSTLQVISQVEFHGLDGLGGPLYVGTGCFHQREILCGRKYSKDYKIDWKTSKMDGTIFELEERAKSLASCVYELNSQWGKEKLYEEMQTRIEMASNLSQIPEEVRDQHKGFAIWNDSYTSKRDHDTILQILIDGRDKTTIDVEGFQMPTLVYLAREKRPQYFHNFKAGAMNALLRVSSKISNGPVILNVDCDMYSNDSQSIRYALCFFMDEKMSQDIGFVQFPQRFENTTKNDVYGSALRTSYEVEFHGLDGFGGPLYIGTGCFHQREILCGKKYSKDYKIDWKNSNVDRTIDELEESAKSLASCTYELSSQWGKEMGLKYGCPIEDVITGLAIQCRGWKSVYMNPKRSAFLGLAATTLDDTLVQHKRWSEGELHIMLTHCPLWYEAELPKVDIFVCTADPVREPPIMVINTVLSVMAYDYPPEKLSIYLSDDEPRSPAAYFSSMHKPIDANYHYSSDFASIKILIDGRDSKAKDVEGCILPTLVYLAREKRPQHFHNFKAGAMNALIRVSSKISNGPIILNVDCDMYSNNPQSIRDALCCFMDEKKSQDIAFVQFPQAFENVTKNDIYGASLRVISDVESPGLDALGGPCYIGTGCFHQREILCGKKYSLDYKANWKIQDNDVAKEQENVEELEEKAKVLASCTYEMNSQWGKEMGLRYGCAVEDILTGLSIHSRGWKSVFLNPKRKAFIGMAPTTLIDTLVQHNRWSEGWLQIMLYNCPLIYGRPRISLGHQLGYCHFCLWACNCWSTLYYCVIPSLYMLKGISLFPKITSTWFLFFAYVIFAKYSYSLGEFISNGGTALGWWNEQRMWLYKRTSAYLLASIDILLKLCGISNMKFVITSKVVDEDVSQRYEKEIMEFGVASPMFVILETLALMNLFTLIFTLKMGYGVIDKLGLQILLSVVLVLVNLPLYEVHVSFVVIKSDSPWRTDDGVDLVVKGPEGDQIHDTHDKISEKFDFTAHKKGPFSFCFTNKSPYHETIDFDVQVGHFTYYDQHAKDEHVKPLVEQIEKLGQSLYNIQFEQHWLEAQTDRQALVNEAMSKRALHKAVMESFALVGASVLQIYLLRRLFERKLGTSRV
uniref:GOLD domain-containing protein n=1 Tax=Chenopodium quinoa TaxID=63459 RepID=A0A803MWN5_CHEQI